MRDDDVDNDDDEPPYSVRRLRQAYLDKIRASSSGLPPRRITPLAASITPSLPYIPEVDEERRITRSHRATSESQLNRPEESDQSRTRRFEPPPPPPPPPTSAPVSLSSHSNQPVPRTNSDRSQKRPSLIAVNVSTEPPVQQQSSGTLKPRETPRVPEGEDYPERLMSPPPTKEPRSIIKQGYYSSHQSSYSKSMQSDHVDRYNDRPETSASQTSGDGPYQNRRKSTNFNDLPEEERYRIMQENLEKHRRGRATTPKPPATSFNGPFFKLEEVNPSRPNEGQFGNGGQNHRDYSKERNNSGMSFAETRTISASEAELSNIKDPTVVIWPPLNDKKTQRSHSVMSRKITDPDRIAEYRRQKQMEEEAMRRHEEEKLLAMTKQMRAMQIQQRRLYEQCHGVVSPVPFIDVDHNPYGSQYGLAQSPAPEFQSPDFGPEPHRMRVYETRPISALSEPSDHGDSVPHNTWRRTYVVEKPREVAKNEILNSEMLLEKEHYEVDILKRRAAFVEKPEEPPEIIRTGRRWQPPPEKPYIWPTFPRPGSVDVQLPEIDYPTGGPRSADNAEYHWAPVVTDPGYRKERKNFTPTNTPPLSPIRGHGTGPLDEAAKRQTKYLIQPSPDGSHRPKPAFRKERKAPSGGFYPHAPNAVKVVRRRPASAQGLLAPVNNGDQEQVEVIHQRNYHKLERGYRDAPPQAAERNGKRITPGRSEPNINDWEKIYELPPHSSTIVGKDVPMNIDIKRRLSNFQGSVQSLQRRQENAHRTYSMDSSIPYGSVHDVSSPPASVHHSERTYNSKRRESGSRQQQQHQLQLQQQQQQQQQEQQQQRRQHQEHPSTSMSHSRSPSTMALSPSSRANTPTAIRVRTKMGQVTAPGPSPASYDRARAHLPRPLPPGYRLGDPPPDPRAVSPAPGNTKRMIRNMTESTQRLDPHHNSFQPIRDRRLSPGSQYL
ncbi:hypothetical protein V3C99_001709 [Haemonchus contortus]